MDTEEKALTDKEQSAQTKYGLTSKQIRLVDTLVASGCSIKEASIKAGYSKKDGVEYRRQEHYDQQRYRST